MGRTTKRKIENRVVMMDDESSDPLQSETKSTPKAPDDSAMVRGSPRRRDLKKTRKTFHRRKGIISKKTQSSFSSLTFPYNGTEYSTSEDNSGSKSSDHDHGRRHRTKRSGNGLQVILTVNTPFLGAVDYQKYRLDNKSAKYDT